MSLTEKTLHYTLFIDKANVICGASKTGKTVLLKDMLYMLKPHIDQIIIISQTDKQNKTFSGEIVPSPLIHDTITDTLLDDIYNRQSALASVYAKIWEDSDVIQRLLAKTADAHVEKAIQEVRSIYKKFEGSDAEYEMKQEECAVLVNSIYKKYIQKNEQMLIRGNLSDDEKYAIKFYKMNPRLIILFDDCTEMISKFKNHHVMNKLFYQGRHSKITTLMACHSDKVLLPEHKKQIFVTIFTDEPSASAYFSRGSTSLDKEEMARAKMAARAAFTPTAKHQKLMFVREEKKFYKITATVHEPFSFGSSIVRDFCEQIKTESGALSRTNKFAYAFM